MHNEKDTSEVGPSLSDEFPQAALTFVCVDDLQALTWPATFY